MGSSLLHQLAVCCSAWIRAIGAVPSPRRVSREISVWKMAGEQNMARVALIAPLLDQAVGTLWSMRGILWHLVFAKMLAFPRMRQNGAVAGPCSFPADQG